MKDAASKILHVPSGGCWGGQALRAAPLNISKKNGAHYACFFIGKTAPAFCRGDFVSCPVLDVYISSPAFLVYSSAMFFIYSAISPHRARFYSQSYLEPFKAAEYIYTV